MLRFALKAEYFLKKEVNELFLMNAMRSFAVSTISIFVPIFLYKAGYSFLDIALYFIVWTGAGLFTCFAALKFASRFGVKHTIGVSVPLVIGFFLALYNLEYLRTAIGDHPTLFIIALLKALQTAFYFMGFHLDFARHSKENPSSELGFFSATATIFSILGPLLGAYIITSYSFNALFIVVMAILLSSVLPLLFSREFHEPFGFDFKGALLGIGSHNGYPFLAEGVRDIAASYFWPLLLYLTVANLTAIGGVYTLSHLMIAGVTLYVGRKMSEMNRKKILNIGAYIHSLSLVLRTVMKTVFTIALVQGFGGISWALLHLPFQSIFYNNSKKGGIAYTTYYREVFLQLGRLVGALIFVTFLFLFDAKMSLVFSIIFGAIAVFVMMRIRDE